jgi:cytoskeletal protein CcmA (bactofilin family)
MKHLKIIILSLALAVTSVVAFTGIAEAQTIRTGEVVTVDEDTVIDSSLLASGNTIRIDSDVEGDVLCAGQNVIISGDVSGDVLCAAQTIRINGTVDGDVRIAGQTVTIGGNVNGSATILTQTFALERNGRIGGDLVGFAQDAILTGAVARDIEVTTSNLTIEGQVGRNVKGTIDTFNIGSSAQIGGDVNYVSNDQPNISSGGQVVGTVSTVQPSRVQKSADTQATVSALIGWALYTLVTMLLLALVLVLLFPRVFHRVASRTLQQPGRVALIGFVAIIAVPVGIFVLFLSVVGIPLALLALLVWFVLIFLSGPFVAYLLGRLILRRNTSPALIMLLGACILLALYFIPIIGLLAMFAAYLFGVGMLLNEASYRLPRPTMHVE